ncbi:Concanavalin A-like lectin/glucanase domain-containing protein [Dioscorea alata]|uniref:Concanavalin A-like lectin/glucanase domain-containing protein n=1 Tax=Dioscorea alata TaxID=55571 RepID=A0ACB7VWB4_DIOAL|nr:Concanavalin A-like lectin/glucanase domain-containing protein [Dioscorea alata]
MKCSIVPFLTFKARSPPHSPPASSLPSLSLSLSPLLLLRIDPSSSHLHQRYPSRVLIMDRRGVCDFTVVVICLLVMMVVRSVSQDDAAVSPAMVAFFRGRPEVALPEALNSTPTDPVWGVAAGRVAPPGPENAGGGKRSRLVLLMAGLACGVVGAALLGAAAVAFASRNRRSEPENRSGLEVVLCRRRTGPEVRLGA